MKSKGVTWKAILIGLLLIPINSFWIIRSETEGMIFYSTTSSLFCNVIFILFILTLLSVFIKLFYSSTAFSQGELLVIYTILSIAAAISGESIGQQLIRHFATPVWSATPENEWTNLFYRYLPQWSIIDNKNILEAFFRGNNEDTSLLYTPLHLKAWLFPLLVWCGFVFVLVFVMICINVIIRKQWIENEKLSYPVIQLPLAMTEQRIFLKNKNMWLGFGIGAGITLLNGAHYIIPAVPGVKNIYDISGLFVSKPWNSATPIVIAFYPSAIGLAYFMPMDLAFSTWFFFLFWKAQIIFGSAFGMHSLPEFPYSKWQQTGGYLAIGILALWTSRRHIFKVFKQAWKKTDSKNEIREPMKYHTAIFGLCSGFAVIVLFGIWLGMTAWLAFCFFGIYFILSIAVTRMRAELGPLVHELYYSNAGQIITAITGTRRISPHSLTAMSAFWWLTRSQNSNVMPHQLEGLKLSERAGINTRSLWIYMVIASVLGIFFCSYALLDKAYRYGTSTGFAYQSYSRLHGWLTVPNLVDVSSVIFMVAGFLFTIFLLFMKRCFLWWSFHPLGYAVTQGDWAITFIWFSIFLSWFIKSIILKYGGLKIHRRATPIFLGLILGDFVIGASWGLFGLMTGIRTYPFKNW
ncbi:hypothetical protein GF312_18470 [Candidatus Poribacteria bacterium]|nr:hypothetical protein [Candidatus Poribacteria bacterium]